MCGSASVITDNVTAARQRLFDRALAHIREQGEASVGRDPTSQYGVWICIYRNFCRGTGCAAAPFITDYSPAMENKTFERLARDFTKSLDPEAAEYAGFVGALQSAHDSAALVEDDNGRRKPVEASVFMLKYEENMEGVAANYGLSYTPPRKEPVFAGCGADSGLHSF